MKKIVADLKDDVIYLLDIGTFHFSSLLKRDNNFYITYCNPKLIAINHKFETMVKNIEKVHLEELPYLLDFLNYSKSEKINAEKIDILRFSIWYEKDAKKSTIYFPYDEKIERKVWFKYF